MMNSIPVRPLASIVCGVRHRKDYGDLDALAESIDKQGLLQPIAITPDGVLIAGARRLLAWQKTKFRDEPIPVHVVPLDEIARGEWAESRDRKDFTLSEAVAVRRALEPGLKAKAKERQGARTDLWGNSPDVAPRRAADQAARLAGRDRRTLDKAEAIVAAAEAEPEKYGKLVDDMDRTGRVDGPYKRLQVMRQSEALRASPPPFRCATLPLYCRQLPWPHEPDEDDPGGLGRALRPYPTMSIAEGRALPLDFDPRRQRGHVDLGDQLPHALRLRAARRLGDDSGADDPHLRQGQDGARAGSQRQDRALHRRHPRQTGFSTDEPDDRVACAEARTFAQIPRVLSPG